MPSKSASQHRLMAAVAHNPSFAKKAGIPQSVGRDFTEADKGRKFAKGGDMKNAAMKKIFAGKETPAEERKEKAAVKKAGMSYKAAEKKFEGKKYAEGGNVGLTDRQKMIVENAKKDEYARQAEKPYNAAMRNTPPAPKEAASAPAKPIKKAMGGCAKAYAGGGMIDGCAQRGKTRGKVV
jgi:hypothetical protein